MSIGAAVLLGLVILSGALGGLRWSRVAQREHYLAGSALRFSLRWWRSSRANVTLGAVGLIGVIATPFWLPGAIGVVAMSTLGPLGLGVRGRTSPLSWTRRLALIAGATVLIALVVIGVAALLGGLRGAVIAAAIAVVLMPLIVDASLAILTPIEDRLAERYVRQAQRILERVRPVVVAITGSYGKTSTKGYIAHLLAGRFSVVASPRSFNNRAGLARTVNELLIPGTDVLVAEMGAYGPGEIAALCRWMPPKVSVITAIGPVHLERFKSLERTLAAKSEITVGAETVVLNVDDERLGGLADELRREGRTVIGVSAEDRSADLCVIGEVGAYALFRSGALIGRSRVEGDASTAVVTNVACALGAASALGCTNDELLARLPGLPIPDNRLEVRSTTGGAAVLDDTFNSNPAGARLALSALEALGGDHRVVVTPGMVELGPLQRSENAAFARTASHIATDLVVVGRTNRNALHEGVTAAMAEGVAPNVVDVADREEAVAWVRDHLGPGDVVLYENDLPDHYA